MHHDEDLRLSNYNYDANAFLTRVTRLLARDVRLLGLAIQRSVMAVEQQGLTHVISRIDLLSSSDEPIKDEFLDYGSLILSREVLTQDRLLKRLEMLSQKQFGASENLLTSAGIGFSDRYVPSKNEYSEWACTVFEVSFGGTQLSHEPLLRPNRPSFSSPFEAIKQFLSLPVFNNMSDARLGRILVAFPNFNARLRNLTLKSEALTVETDGAAPPDRLKLDLSYSHKNRTASREEHLTDRTLAMDFGFVPSELKIWLLSTDGYICDYHDENDLYSSGSNPVLKKQNLTAVPFEIRQPSDYLLAGDSSPSNGRRVFLIHGHDLGLRETIARFLEQLDLEAVILAEQPSGGNTIIEKFEIYSDVVFAVAVLTGDDEAKPVRQDGQLRRRARQNVIFEFGYFIGRLGRNRVCALMEEGVEIPSDYSGVVYIPVDSAGMWKVLLVRELKAAGIDVDANQAI